VLIFQENSILDSWTAIPFFSNDGPFKSLTSLTAVAADVDLVFGLNYMLLMIFRKRYGCETSTEWCHLKILLFQHPTSQSNKSRLISLRV